MIPSLSTPPKKPSFNLPQRVSVCLLAAFVLSGCDKKAEPAPNPPPATNPPAATSTNAAAAPAVNADYAQLQGKWLRADGDYTVDIKSVAPDGKLEVGYFNPNPINVSRAAAMRGEGATKVFIELRDENYPGCTYSLALDKEHDQLFGEYYQAALQQTFSVTFARKK